MGVFFSKLFSTSDYPARWYCGSWSSDVGWLHIISDLGIFSAYFAIPCVLLVCLLRRRDIPFHRVLWLFAAFILSCGLGHFLEALIFWWPAYRLAGLLKLQTAVISWLTVFMLIRLLPTALKLPSAALMADRLLRSQERLGVALEAGQIGVWEIEYSSRIATSDGRTLTLLGLPPDSNSLWLEDWVAAVHPDDLARVIAHLDEPLSDQTTLSFSYRVVVGDGSIRYLQSAARAVVEQQSNNRVLIGVTFDVTEKHERESALRESEQNFRGVFENAALGIAQLNQHGRIVKANRTLCEMLGRNQDRLQQLHLADVVYPDEKEGKGSSPIGLGKTCDALVEKLQTGEINSFSLESRFVRADQRPFWVNLTVSMVLSQHDDNVHFIVLVKDITLRRKTELELEDYHARVKKLSLVASKTQHSVVITDSAGYVEWVNAAFTRLTGFESHEVIGKKPGQMLQGPATDPITIDQIRQALSVRESFATEILNYHKEGHSYWIELKIDPVLDDAGKLTNFIATQVDISGWKEAESGLQHAKQIAEEASRAKSDFLATMSHELRTPLNGVIGMSELLADTPLDAQQARFVSACRKSGQHLLCLINDILDFSKIEAGKLELDSQPFDLLQLMEDIVESLQYRAEEKGIALRYRLHHPVPLYLIGDCSRLRQVLVNLVGNAIKFTSEGFVSLDVIPQVSSTSHAAVYISIKDTGIGIPAARMQRLFREFSQIDRSINRQYGGTGLGLSISKSIVEAMGGKIGVNSVVGLGSEFWMQITFPCANDCSSLIPSATEALSQQRVLLAEPELACREYLEQLLSNLGLSVVVANSRELLIDQLSVDTRGFDLLVVEQSLLEGQFPTRLLERYTLDSTRLIVVGLDRAINIPTMGKVRRLPKPASVGRLHSELIEVFANSSDSKKGGESVSIEHHLDAIQQDEGEHSAADDQSLTVLLAEDHATNRLFAQEIIKRQGWRVEIACDGREAVQAATKNTYDVILMDCQMPDMDGYEAVQVLRSRQIQDRFGRPVPVIALTANAIQGDRERCLVAGMDDYLTKPFTAGALVEKVQRLVAQPASTTGNMDVALASSLQQPTTLQLPQVVDSPVMDFRVLVEERCMGDLDFAKSLLESFRTNSKLRLEQIISSAQQGKAVDVSRAAHGMTGIAGIVTADRLSMIARRIEDAGRDNDLETILASLEELEREVARVQETIDGLPLA